MEKKILITTDGSIYSRKAIEYTVRMESVIKDLNYILLNIQPKISEFLIEDARMDGKARAALKNVISKTNKKNTMLIVIEIKIEILYRNIDIILASTKDKSPLIKGRYCLDILSVFISAAWFKALEAPFNISKDRLAGIILIKNASNKLTFTSL